MKWNTVDRVPSCHYKYIVSSFCLIHQTFVTSWTWTCLSHGTSSKNSITHLLYVLYVIQKYGICHSTQNRGIYMLLCIYIGICIEIYMLCKNRLTNLQNHSIFNNNNNLNLCYCYSYPTLCGWLETFISLLFILFYSSIQN